MKQYIQIILGWLYLKHANLLASYLVLVVTSMTNDVSAWQVEHAPFSHNSAKAQFAAFIDK